MRTFNRIFSFCLGLGLIVASGACSNDSDIVVPEDGIVEYRAAQLVTLSTEQAKVAANSSSFSNNLFSVTSQIKKDENFIISPLGASLVLSMAANATGGNTQEQILNALNIDASDISTLNALNLTLLKELPSISSCTLKLFNSAWYNIDQLPSLLPNFTKSLTDNYLADLYGISNKDYVTKVNAWISEKTANGIDQFLKKDSDDEFLLSFFNIMDFYGAWNAMGKRPTIPMTFHNSNGTATELTSIVFDNIFAWSTGHCYIFDIPYVGASSAGYFLRIIFPYPGENIDNCLSTYKAFLDDPVNRYYATMHPEDEINLKVYLPKLAFESAVDLTPMIKQLGVTDLFDREKCDISGASLSQKGYMDKLKQYSRIRLDETGTKVQTATSLEGLVGAAIRPIPTETKIDRPFALEIYEASTGVSILQGRINVLQ